MELVDKQADTTIRSWIPRVNKKHPGKEDYHSELRSWVQRAILAAEKKKDFYKKGQLLNLLKDL
jgi:hypothetical protein